MPWYRREGKIERILSEKEFAAGMQSGYFVEKIHRPLCVLYYYAAVRKVEGVRVIRDQFQIDVDYIYFDVGQRLKHSKETPALPIPKSAPFVAELEALIIATPKGERLFPFTDRTAYNVVRRVFKYPHWFRLSRITWFFLPHPELNRSQGFSVAEVRNWTGLSLRALDYYLGLASLQTMGKALGGGE